MKKFNVTGMSCAACSARVEKAVNSLAGVESCAVNLLSGSMTVRGTATVGEIITAVEKAGYGAQSSDGAGTAASANNARANAGIAAAPDESASLLRSLLASAFFLVLLMYFSMGHTMLSLPLPAFFSDNPAGIALVQMILAAIVMLINKKFFVSGTKSIIRLSPNMDALVALGSGAAFIYSTAVLFIMCRELADGNTASAQAHLHDLYFESAAMILALISVGKSLEARSKTKTGAALRALGELAPEYATVLRDGSESTVPIAELSAGDIFLVRPGEQIPVDGFILEGSTAVNEAAITGESVPAEKGEGDTVVGATLNTSGFIKCRATRVGGDTVLSRIIETVNDAASSKAPIAKAADKVASVFVPAVMAIALVTAIVWLILGEGVGFALARAISVLVISCPCSLGLATPVAIMVGSGVGARHGILFKNAEILEGCGRVKSIVLDKTGTVTSGDIKVTGVYCMSGISEEQLLSAAYAVEEKSEHPLAAAVTAFCRERGIKASDSKDFKAYVGSGVSAVLDGRKLFGGKREFIENEIKGKIPAAAEKLASELSALGNTPLMFAAQESFLGIIAVSDTVKPDSRIAVERLESMGLSVVLLSGDNAEVTHSVAKKAGIKNAISDATPDSKAREIEQLRQWGRVAMVGDGINDAPALAKADIGMAIGTGTDIARDTAGVILMGGSLMEAANAVKLSRAVLRNIHQNLFWAFIYNCIGIPVAAGVLSGFGITLSPMLGALAMGLSSFCVVTNALRLNTFRPEKVVLTESSKDEEINQIIISSISEKKEMEKIFNVEGMMCHHCEAHVKKALEAIDGVTEAIASHERGTVTVKLSKDIADTVLADAITAEGYKVL